MKYLLIITVALFLLPTVLAQSPSCPIQSPDPGVAKGLISTPTLSGNLGSDTGACVIDPKAPFAPFKIPTYDDLKSLYYDQSKAEQKVLTNAVLTSTQLDDQKVHFRDGNLDVNASLSYTVTAVVFVNGYLSINQNITGSAGTGLVLVVKDNVNIQSTVTQVDAVIIAGGPIYTAGVGCNTNSESASALTINGSLISLNLTENIPIKFCRTLADNSSPAEIIINQPKYLVLLRNLLSDTYQKWSEIQ